MPAYFLKHHLSLVTGVIGGVISGLYTGVVSAKYSAFEESRREILKVLRSIHYDDGKYIQGHEEDQLNRIWLASSEFLTMGQKAAGLLTRNHYGKLVANISGNTKENILSEQILMDFQIEVREMNINKLGLLFGINEK